MNYFYSHLLDNYHELLQAIASLPIKGNDKKQALHLLNKTIHYTVIDTILENTHYHYHERIITKIKISPDDHSVLSYVNDITGLNIEEKIRDKLITLHLKLLEDLSNGGDQ